MNILASMTTCKNSWLNSGDRISTSKEHTNDANKPGCEEQKRSMFMMNHGANSMITSTSKTRDIWLVDSGVSNHMTSHGAWFQEPQKIEKPAYMETANDSTHQIEHISDVIRQRGH